MHEVGYAGFSKGLRLSYRCNQSKLLKSLTLTSWIHEVLRHKVPNPSFNGLLLLATVLSNN